jgi:serine/threonine-protein kinase
LGRVALERGKVSAALTSLRAALAISRRGGDLALIGDSELTLADALLGSSRAVQAMPFLTDAHDLLAERYGPTHATVGDSERLLGEAAAALGQTDAAQRHFDTAVRLTRRGYGEQDPKTRLAEFSLARFQARGGDAAALARLDALAALPKTDTRLRAVAWRARAAAAQVRCAGSGRDAVRHSLDQFIGELQAEQPDGGKIVREVVAIRAACG